MYNAMDISHVGDVWGKSNGGNGDVWRGVMVEMVGVMVEMVMCGEE